MPIINGTGTYGDILNLTGELHLVGNQQTPLFTMLGGMGNGQVTSSMEFSVGQSYDIGNAEQPAISEAASLVAPTPTTYVRGAETNSIQLHQEVVALSYLAQSKGMSVLRADPTTLEAASGTNPVVDQMMFQVRAKLAEMAADMEFSFLQGTYQQAVDKNTAGKTRGMLEACSINSIDAVGAPLTRELMDDLVGAMHSNGAILINPVIFVGAKQKSRISNIYGLQPASYEIGGVNVNRIITDHAEMSIVFDRFMPDNAVLIADMAAVNAVYLTMPNRPAVFMRPIESGGASDMMMIYAQVGLNHGPAQYHGKITNLMV